MDFLENLQIANQGAALKALLLGIFPASGSPTSSASLSAAAFFSSAKSSLSLSSSSARFDLDSATLDKVWIAILGIEALMILGLVLARLFHSNFRKQRHLEMYL